MSGKETKKRILWEYKLANPTCAHCGGQFHPCQLDLHHPDEADKNPTLKLPRPSGRRRQIIELPRKEFDEEITKCIILCKNCHAMHHYGGD